MRAYLDSTNDTAAVPRTQETRMIVLTCDKDELSMTQHEREKSQHRAISVKKDSPRCGKIREKAQGKQG